MTLCGRFFPSDIFKIDFHKAKNNRVYRYPTDPFLALIQKFLTGNSEVQNHNLGTNLQSMKTTGRKYRKDFLCDLPSLIVWSKPNKDEEMAIRISHIHIYKQTIGSLSIFLSCYAAEL